MVLDGGTESGAELWVCLSCDRRMLLRWPPHYEKLVLEPGDEASDHVGSKGGLRVNAAAPAPQAPREVPDSGRQWLREHGIDWDGAPS